MNTIEALNSRYCCRAFKPQPVKEETVLKIIAAATRAPSWANTQPWEIFVAAGEPLERLRRGFLTNLEKGVQGVSDLPRPQTWPAGHQQRTMEFMAARAKVLGIARDDQAARQTLVMANYRFFDAPVVIYLCMDRTLTAWSVFDLGALSQSIMLAARDFGLDTAPAVMLAHYPELIRAELKIPDSFSIIIGIALGFADSDQPTNKIRSPRRPISEVVRLKGF